MSNMAAALKIEPDQLSPLSMERYFEDHVPLGNHSLLTYFAMIIARMSQLYEQGNMDGLRATICTAALFVEQTCLDSGKCQVAWQYTTLAAPAWHKTRNHRRTPEHCPFPATAHPKWMSQNLQYLRELDQLTQRVNQVQTPVQTAAPAANAMTGVNPSDGQDGRARPVPWYA